MAKYLVQAKYVSDGYKSIVKEGGSVRRAAVEKLVGPFGGKVEAFYYAFGDTDVYIILDMPDNVSMASASITVNSVGADSIKVTVLLTPEEIDEAGKMSPINRAPGQ